MVDFKINSGLFKNWFSLSKNFDSKFKSLPKKIDITSSTFTSSHEILFFRN